MKRRRCRLKANVEPTKRLGMEMRMRIRKRENMEPEPEPTVQQK
jgi:hypothetical protein